MIGPGAAKGRASEFDREGGGLAPRIGPSAWKRDARQFVGRRGRLRDWSVSCCGAARV